VFKVGDWVYIEWTDEYGQILSITINDWSKKEIAEIRLLNGDTVQYYTEDIEHPTPLKVMELLKYG
jgi:hypothetical protein